MQNCAILIPCYNEEKRLNQGAFIKFITHNPLFTMYFVNDGSKDNTLEMLNKLKADYPDSIKVIDLKKNVGKAEALRTSFLEVHSNAQYSSIGFLDADLSTSLEEFADLKHLLHNDKLRQIVFGSRVMRLGSNIKRHALRHYLGRVAATLTSIITRLPLYDSQCGAKVFDAELIPLLFGKPFISKWLFDVELILRMQKVYSAEECLKLIYEHPLTCWEDIGGSKISAFAFLKAPFNLFRIYWHYQVRKK